MGSDSFFEDFKGVLAECQRLNNEGEDVYDYFRFNDQPKSLVYFRLMKAYGNFDYFYRYRDAANDDNVKQTIDELEATIARVDDPETNKRENDKVEELIKKRWIGLLHGELHDDWLRNYSADQEFYDDVSAHVIRDEDNAFYSVNIESFEKDGDNVYIKFELNIDHKDWVYESNDNIAWIVDGECGVLFDHILPRKNTADKYKGWAELTNEEKFDRLSAR